MGSCGKKDSEKALGRSWSILGEDMMRLFVLVGDFQRAPGVEEAQQVHQGLLRAALRGRETRAAVLMTNLPRQWPVSIREFGGWQKGDVAHHHVQ